MKKREIQTGDRFSERFFFFGLDFGAAAGYILFLKDH